MSDQDNSRPNRTIFQPSPLSQMRAPGAAPSPAVPDAASYRPARAAGSQDDVPEAPAGLASTGDPVFNRAWSLLHTPSVQVPITTGPRNLPLGLQVVGRIGDDARTLAVAHWIETRLREPQ